MGWDGSGVPPTLISISATKFLIGRSIITPGNESIRGERLTFGLDFDASRNHGILRNQLDLVRIETNRRLVFVDVDAFPRQID